MAARAGRQLCALRRLPAGRNPRLCRDHHRPARDSWLAGPQTVDFSLSKTDDFITACVKMAEAADIPSMQRQPGEWRP